MLFEVPVATASHPARYTDILLPVMARMLRGSKRILDPFGGTGKVFLLSYWLPDPAEIQAVEIEPEWAARDPRITLGNALSLRWSDGYFDAICTSPTYGNRMADTFNDGGRRLTYTAQLGRTLHADNSGSLQWGPRYRAFHALAWIEAKRVLRPGGVFVLNIKDHIRAGKQMYVTDWHVKCLVALGFVETERYKIGVPSMRYGKNQETRIPYENVIAFRNEET